MHTSTLRLYHVPLTSKAHNSSQARVARRGGAVENIPLEQITALEVLRARTPFDGPYSDAVAFPPWEVPNWEGRMTHMGVAHLQDWKAWVDDLYQDLPLSAGSIISIARTVSNKGQFDNQMVGSAAAILTMYEGMGRCNHTKHWCGATQC
jgi:hypothetical protein